MTEITKSIRYRVNVSTSVKGQKTWDCTCDGEGFTLEEVLAESDRLVSLLDQRYPAPEVKEGKEGEDDTRKYKLGTAFEFPCSHCGRRKIVVCFHKDRESNYYFCKACLLEGVKVFEKPLEDKDVQEGKV